MTEETNPEVVVLDRFAPGREEEDLARNLRGRGVTVAWWDWGDVRLTAAPARLLVKGRPMPPPRVAVARSRVWTRHTAGDLVLLFDALRMLADLGTRVTPHPEGVALSKNKLRAAALLHAGGVPVPETRLVHDIAEIGACLDEWEEIVLKPVFGHSAIDMIRFHRQTSADPDIPGGLTSLQEITSWHLIQTYGAVLAQRFVRNPGADIRVLYVADRIVSATRRATTSPTLEVKNMFHAYEETLIPITEELERLAAGCARVLGLDSAAIDLVEGKDGLCVIEANSTVSSWCTIDAEGLHQSPAGVGAAFADMVYSLVEEHRAADATRTSGLATHPA